MGKIVDEYSINIEEKNGFRTVQLVLKLDNGAIEGPFEFVPPFAHQLSDELCTASARAASETSLSGTERTTRSDLDELPDESHPPSPLPEE